MAKKIKGLKRNDRLNGDRRNVLRRRRYRRTGRKPGRPRTHMEGHMRGHHRFSGTWLAKQGRYVY